MVWENVYVETGYLLFYHVNVWMTKYRKKHFLYLLFPTDYLYSHSKIKFFLGSVSIYE